MFFLRNHQYIICNFGGWPKNYLTMSEAVWTSMLHCLRSAVQFSREICSWTTQGPQRLLKDLLNVALIFDICNVYEIVTYDWLYSQY